MLSLSLVMLGGCAVPAPGRDTSLLEDDGTPDSKADGTNALDALSAELTKKYGLRPRRYGGLLHRKNSNQVMFSDALPTVTTFLKERAAAMDLPIPFDQAAIATNFISEGGFNVLECGTFYDCSSNDPIDGYADLGIDTLVDNYAAVKPWLTPELQQRVESEEYTETATNELGNTVTYITVANVAQGLSANAAMFAWARALFVQDLSRKGIDVASLPSEALFFWTTLYYNAGPAFGRRQLNGAGVTLWSRKWTQGESADYEYLARYNALWRTSTYEFMLRGRLVED